MQQEPDAIDDLFDASPDEPRQPPRSRRALRRWLIVLVSLLSVLAVGAGALTFYGVQTLNTVKREPGLLPSDRPTVDPGALVAQPINFLLLGSDSRGQDRGRSDVMMLVHSDPSRAKLYLISLPRDLWVPIPGHGTNKINAAYAFGGGPLAVRTVENLLGIEIDHVALTDFEGFFRLVDDVGGVSVFNTIPSSNHGFDFARGDIRLTGASALAYVRQRYDLPRGDFDRAERQRLVVTAIIDKVASSQTLTNPARLLAVVDRLSRSVTVDATLTNQRVVDLVRELQITSGQDIEQLQVPVAGFGRSSAGASYVKVDKAGIARLGDALSSGRMGSYRG